MQSKPQRTRPFHILLFAIYPALALLAVNADQVAPTDVLRPLLISLLLAGAIYAAFRLLLRHPGRAALATTVTLIVLLSYGHLYNEMKSIGLSQFDIVRHRYLLPVVVVALAAGVYGISKTSPSPRVTTSMNVIGLALVAFPITTLLLTATRASLAFRQTGEQPRPCSLHPPAGEPLPDIYFIVMDAYERDDVLREMHGADITPFLEWLEARGFYIPRAAMSNYRHTELSIPTTLNMDYVQSLLGTDSPPQEEGRWRMVKMIRDNRLRRELECLGYTTVGIETGVSWTEWRDADYYIAQDTDPLHSARLVGSITPFEREFLETTGARAVLDGFRSRQRSAPVALDPNEATRRRILFAFDQLQRVPGLPSPKLVFVHILSPHPPFVFGPNGEPISQADFRTTYGPGEPGILKAYADQVAYLNTKLQETVTTILDSSTVPPVIVIEGDHGWADRNHEDKLSNFNAIHLPAGGNDRLYASLTPVNTFRIVLDEYFGGDYPLLPDVSYYSTEDDLFDLMETPNTRSEPGP